MLKIYTIPPSLYCAKLRILLRHKGLVWEEIPPPGGYGSAEYRALVPGGNLPALRDGELLLADSEAIAEYLNEKHLAPPMLPDGLAPRAEVRERSRYHDTRLEPAVRALFPFVARSARGGFDMEAHSAVLRDRLGGLVRLLEKAPPGDSLTLADCGYPITLLWLERLAPVLGLGIVIPEAVEAYRRGLEAYPAVAVELAQYGSVHAAWLEERVAG